MGCNHRSILKMRQYQEVLIGKSFESVPGELYNQYRWDVARQTSDRYLFYEVSLLEAKPWEFLRDHVYPSFIRYLKAKFVDPENAHGVVVAVFHKDQCHLLKGVDFIKAFGEIEEISAPALRAKIRQWLSD